MLFLFASFIISVYQFEGREKKNKTKQQKPQKIKPKTGTCFFPRILTKLLEVSDDPQVLAVAAHDVGEYVRHYPRGKR